MLRQGPYWLLFCYSPLFLHCSHSHLHHSLRSHSCLAGEAICTRMQKYHQDIFIRVDDPPTACAIHQRQHGGGTTATKKAQRCFFQPICRFTQVSSISRYICSKHSITACILCIA
ncbi:hypothetical protein BX070DRAFT_113024 [Coemansia spiralis]|nr:hypothetical protein BX070DRAFT_113024 [Coemansia spiralis]